MSRSFNLRVLYEDNHLLVVEKPANVPVQADISGDEDLLTVCKQYIKETYLKPGEVYLGMVHRLDRPVGGVMVFARTSKAAARLTAQFKSHTAKKRYVAIVQGDTAYERYLTDWLIKDEQTNSSHVTDSDTEGAKKAELKYTTLGRINGYSLIDIELYTGRPHQIRVQLSHDGHPLYGDQRYGKLFCPGTQIRLWAYALTVKHPTLDEEMTFYSSPCVPEGDIGSIRFEDFSAQTAMLPAFSVCRGVYTDNDVIVADKNAGVEVETDLLPALQSIFQTVYPVHRLDANTEGLVIFARNEAAEKTLLEAFRAHAETTKIYRAILCHTPSRQEGILENWLVKDADDAFVRAVPEGTPGAVKAKLSYRVLNSDESLSLVEIRLFTGRTHQIRVQFASIGCPVLGDDKYGDRDINKRFKCRHQQLLAAELTVTEKTFYSQRTLALPKKGVIE